MGDYSGWIKDHIIEIWATWYVFSAAVSSLPTPVETSGNLYRFFFTFLHTLAGSIGRIPYFRNIVTGNGQTTTTTTLTTKESVPSVSTENPSVTTKTATVTTTQPVKGTDSTGAD